MWLKNVSLKYYFTTNRFTDGDVTKKYCSTSVYNNKKIKSLKLKILFYSVYFLVNFTFIVYLYDIYIILLPINNK